MPVNKEGDFEFQGEGYTLENPPPGYEKTSKAKMELHNRALKDERLMPTTNFKRQLGNLAIPTGRNYAELTPDEKMFQRGTAGPSAPIDEKFAQRGSVQLQGPRTPGALGGDPMAGWDYQNPPENLQGVPLNHKGEELPPLAGGWDPNGNPYFGKGLQALWKKSKSNMMRAKEKGYGLDVEGKDKLWQKYWQAAYGEYSMPRNLAKSYLLQPLGAALEAPARGMRRLFGTASLTQQDISQESALPELPTVTRDIYQKGFLEKAEWMFDVAERLSPPRHFYNVYRTLEATISGKYHLEDVTDDLKKNWQLSRMAYSIGANDQQKQEEFFRRIQEGENPELVALDMEQPLSEMLGLMLNDPLNALDIVSGGAVQSGRIMSASDEAISLAPEIARIANLADEPADILRGASGTDEMVGAVGEAIARVSAGANQKAGKFGLFHRIGSAKRFRAFMDTGIFARALGYSTRNADETADVVRYMAMLASDNEDEVRIAVNYLTDALDNPNLAFSEPGLEFAHYMRSLMDDGAGNVNPAKFLEGVQGFIDEDDIAGLMQHTVGKLENAIDNAYPTIQEIIDAEKILGAGEHLELAHPGALKFLENGGEIRAIDRIINRTVNKTWLGNFQREVAGRLFIGMNPGVALRGAAFDTVLSSIEMGADINVHSPQRWAEMSESWLKFDHPGLMQGFSKSDIANLDKWADTNSSYKDMGSLIDAIVNKGAKAEDIGMGEKAWDSLTNFGGRMMQWFEMKHSQRVVGKATDDAMRHLIKKTMPAIDEMVDAGLSEQSARSLTQKLINSTGDVDAVRQNFLQELATNTVDGFKDMSWLPDELDGVLNEFNVYEQIYEAIQSGTKEEVIDALKTVRDELLGSKSHLTKQHALPSKDPTEMMSDIGTALDGAFATLSDGDISAEELNEVANIIQANQNTKDAVLRAISKTKELLQNRIRAATQGNLALTEEAIQRMNNAVDAIPNAADEFAEITGKSRSQGQKAREFTNRLKNADPSDLPVLKEEIWEFFGFSDEIPRTRRQVQDYMWTHYFQGRTEDFSRARSAAVSIFEKYLDDIAQVVPEQYVNEIMNHEDIRAVFKNEDIARAIEQSVMIDGEHRPLGQLIRGFVGIGDNENAARSIAAFMDPHVHSIKPGQSFHDTTIKQIVNRFMDIEFENLSDLEPEVVFEAYRRFRQNESLPQLAGTIDDLVGYKPQTKIPMKYWDVNTALRSLKDKTAPDIVDLQTVFGLIRREGSVEQVARLDELSEAGDVMSATDEVYEIGRDILNSALDATDDILKSTDDILEQTGKVIPPHDGSAPSYPRHVYESRDRIWASFNNLIEGVHENYGRSRYEGVGQEALGAVNRWFDEARGRMSGARAAAAQYASEMRNFILHDYPDRMGVDSLLSSFLNFHFWPTRTAVKTLKRLPYNIGIVNKYIQYRNAMGKIHADSPEWYRYNLNTNEILGLNMDNPVFFNLENMFNPYANFMGGFDNPDRRVNWWSSVVDGLSHTGIGHPNIIIQYGTALALKMQGEEEAASLFGGRLAPISEPVKGISALLGINEGRGIELDPAIRMFSDQGFFDEGLTGRTLGPYERKRVVNALAQIAADNPELEAETIEDAWKNGGPLWDHAIAMARQKDAVGRLTSMFTGVGARLRSKEDLTISQYWQDYFKVYSLKQDLSPREYRENMEILNQQYPFAETMMLGRRGADERDGAYAYSVLGRIPPGQTDDFAEVMGIPYELVEKFYDDKGDFSNWTEGDQKRFMGSIATMGAALDIPDEAVQREWTDASIGYTEMIGLMEENFGEDIMNRIDAAYNQKGAGPVNSQDAFSDYLENNPTVEAAMEWRSRYILQDPILSAYYGGLDKLRKYYEGRMWEELSNQFGDDIWDKWAEWGTLKDTGQDERARQYRNEHPELKAYSEAKKGMLSEIEDVIVEFGNQLPEGKGAVLRESAGEGIGEQQIIESENAPEVRNFTAQEWTRMLGPELARLGMMAYEGETPPEDIRNILENAANSIGMTYDELIISLGTAE